MRGEVVVQLHGACVRRWRAFRERAAHAARRLDDEEHVVGLLPGNARHGRISPALFGLNLELTRHAIFNGLSAQIVANRQFASFDGGWPHR